MKNFGGFLFFFIFFHPSEMMWILLIFVCFSVVSGDTYRESHREIALANSPYSLVELGFEISTNHSNSRHAINLFPQPIAAVLFSPTSDDLLSFQANIVRGQWKSFFWGDTSDLPISIHPPGSSLFMTTTKTNQTSALWTKTAWMFSAITGIAFESLCPEQGQFRWMLPNDIVLGENLYSRTASNPNDPCCTENVDRLLELLPCRSRGGLGAVIPSLIEEFARAEFFQISIRTEKKDKMAKLHIQIATVFSDYGRRIMSVPVRARRYNTCPFVALSDRNSLVEMPGNGPVGVVAKRSLIGTQNRPERHQGKFVIHITNKESTHRSIEYHEQLPFFLVPLWHTASHIPRKIFPSDGRANPGFVTWSFSLAPNETVTIYFDVYKKFIPNYHSTFGFEKGFDLGGAVVHILDTDHVFLTRGLIAIIPLGDGSALFNFLAVGCTAFAIFFGFIFRFFYAKRSVVGGTDEAALAERRPPIVKIVNFIISRITVLVEYVSKYRKGKRD